MRLKIRQIQKNPQLHGNVPDCCPIALLLVDVINDLDFPGNGLLLRNAQRLGEKIANLKRRCEKLAIPVIYANDNHGRWCSQFSEVLAHCLDPDSPGLPLVNELVPNPTDYVILKPKHSAFYATPLDTLLSYLQTKVVILVGLTTAACVLMTAGEIYIRDLKLYVPSDCVMGLNKNDQRIALSLIRKSFGGVISRSSTLNLQRMLADSRK